MVQAGPYNRAGVDKAVGEFVCECCGAGEVINDDVPKATGRGVGG